MSSVTDKIVFCEYLLSEITEVQFLKHKKGLGMRLQSGKQLETRGGRTNSYETIPAENFVTLLKGYDYAVYYVETD